MGERGVHDDIKSITDFFLFFLTKTRLEQSGDYIYYKVGRNNNNNYYTRAQQ